MIIPLPDGLILGHRGAPVEAPENTLRSFRRAREHGADGIEFDVQPSADGVPVVIHDDTVDRTTGEQGAVADLPWAALARLDAGAGHRGAGSGEHDPIPRLEEVAEWAAETGAWLNVELKAAGAEAASLAILRDAGVLDRVIFSSFDPHIVRAVGHLDASVRRFLLTEDWTVNLRLRVAECGAGGVCLAGEAATPPALRDLARAGLPVVVWTVDDPARIAELLRAGVAAVITNDPARGVAARREAAAR
ncbi:MAG: glycerophosphodiester phosphodiesterase [Gemmatimonadetes bacterium]|nr:glycerophosphodiester phosphodiesterase [Gemmatimonadota bacterium]